MEIKSYKDFEAKNIVEKLLEKMEKPYNDGYKRRFIPMLEGGSIEEVFIIFIENNPIGLLVLRKVDGKLFFDSNKEVLRLTLFRILPEFRNKGYGTQIWEKVSLDIFKKYKIDKLYSESLEFGALKLYNKLGVTFFENQIVKEIDNKKINKETIFTKKILELNYENKIRLGTDIKFYMKKEDYLDTILK